MARKKQQRGQTKEQRKQCIAGVEVLLGLGFSQAQLARMFDANTATINQWIRFGRVGAWLVGRILYIPELRTRTTIRQLRPDFAVFDVDRAIARAKAWYETTPSEYRERARETPGIRRNAAKTPLTKKFLASYRAARA